MTFLHKLSQRLARMKTALLIGIVTTIACEVPVAVSVTAPPSSSTGMWPNEPAGWSMVTDYGFNDVIPTGGDVAISAGWRIANGAGRITRITDGTAPVSPSNVARIF